MVTQIAPNDKDTNAQVDALLEAEGIRRDRNLDYTCGIFDDDGRLIATGSCFRQTLRCMAVDGGHRGEGLMNAVVSHLLTVQLERGYGHVFLYTKPDSARFFADLGFYEIARTEKLVFMENRRTGFSGYLGRCKACGPAACIVMHANPFTLGHRYLLEQAAKAHERVHLFVLSEEASPIPFAVRKRLVQAGAADLPNVILHDAGPYIISRATFPSYFLKDEEEAVRAQAALDLAVFLKIAEALQITDRYVGEEPVSRVTAIYNETMARELPKRGVACHIVPRLTLDGEPISASAVRRYLRAGDLDAACRLLPQTGAAFFRSEEAAPVIRAIRTAGDPQRL